jgi:hypothetical protein
MYNVQHSFYYNLNINLQFTELHAYIVTHRITERTVSSDMN